MSKFLESKLIGANAAPKAPPTSQLFTPVPLYPSSPLKASPIQEESTDESEEESEGEESLNSKEESEEEESSKSEEEDSLKSEEEEMTPKSHIDSLETYRYANQRAELSDSEAEETQHRNYIKERCPNEAGDVGVNSQVDSMHSIIHEIISTLSQSNPLSHELLDEIWLQLPLIDSMVYPTEHEFPDAGDRQAHMLFIITRLYEGVTQEIMKSGKTAEEIYCDSDLLRKIMEDNFA